MVELQTRPPLVTTPAARRTVVLGVGIDPLTPAQTIERLLRLVRAEPPGRVIAYANAHTLNLAWTDAAYRADMAAADLVYADGQGAVLAARWCGGPATQRANFADIYEPVCAQLAAQGARLFLLGGPPGAAARAGERLRQRWPALSIVGTQPGHFAAAEEPAVAQTIAQARPDLVLVGMGSPRQEAWAMCHRALPVRAWWCVGAALELLSGDERWTPAWIRRCGLEWCFRLGRHPRRLWRRYLIGLPLFAWRLVLWRCLHRQPPA